MIFFGIVLAMCTMASLAADDKKWVWDGNNREKSSGRFLNNDGPEVRYEVFEPQDSFNRPQYGQGGFQRPPQGSNFGPINNNRPGGIYGGQVNRPSYGPINRPDYGGEQFQGVLSGPQNGPYKEFDKCKCTERFNCNSNGISYGHCDVGKQYCCYSSKSQLGGPPPSRPIHSIDNGVLVGPGGPQDFNGRPGRPVYRPTYGVGGQYGGNYNNRPIHSAENGVLVGPGGPFDRPGRPHGGGYGRSAKSQSD